MADRQQTDPAPQWWSRPEGTPDEGRRGGVPAPRPVAGDEAGAGDGVPLQDASPAPETAAQTA
ncbi:hypothetical protein ACFVZQ_17920, partial [Streptomyces sp. NPDC059538]